MRTIHREIVSGLIFSQDNKLFEGLKDPVAGGVYSDCWHIPGGGVDAGETKIGALIREIKEETGIDIAPYKIELIDDQGAGESEKILQDTKEKVLCQMHFNVYKIVINDRGSDQIEVNLTDDLVKYKWADIGELKDLKLTPPSVELFKRLGYL